MAPHREGEAGGEEAFDYVVLAAPPDGWPAIDSPFEWDPSQYTMSHGPAVKFLNAFETPFWLDQGLAPSALWDMLGSVWESTDKQPTDQLGFGLSVYSGGPYVLDEANYPDLLSQIFPGSTPTDTRFVDWPNTPWIWTGYSVPSPSQVCTVGQSLHSPYADRLHFAGEQSHVPFFGYMEGALQSGAKAARDIVAVVCPEALA